MLALGMILYLVARTLPRIKDGDIDAPKTLKPHWIMIYFEKADEWLKPQFEKWLRRVKVWILKLDNWVSGKLSSFKKEASRETKIPLEGDNNSDNQSDPVL